VVLAALNPIQIMIAEHLGGATHDVSTVCHGQHI